MRDREEVIGTPEKSAHAIRKAVGETEGRGERGSVAIVDAAPFFVLSLSLSLSPLCPRIRDASARPPRIINLITRFSDNDPFRLFPDFSPDIVRDKKGAEKTDLAEVGRIDK